MVAGYAKKGLYVMIILLFSNFFTGKFLLVSWQPNGLEYVFQTCDGSFVAHDTQFEDWWKNKKGIENEFKFWKENHPGNDDKILYRTFEFKWWKFWEYYTYLTEDIYNFPTLPKNCKIRSVEDFRKDK